MRKFSGVGNKQPKQIAVIAAVVYAATVPTTNNQKIAVIAAVVYAAIALNT